MQQRRTTGAAIVTAWNTAENQPARRPMPGAARQQAERDRPAPRLRGALIQKRQIRQ